MEWDLGAVNNFFAKIFPAGFYYKTFMRPRFAWKHLFEPVIRNAAGLGRAPTVPDQSLYDYFYAHEDVLIVGAGISGLLMTYELAKSGLNVLLVEQKISFARKVANEFRLMEKGRILSSGLMSNLSEDLIKKHLLV